MSGESLKVIKQNPDYLLKIQETKQIIDAVCVKKLSGDASLSVEATRLNTFFNTFRVYDRTKFSELKKAACSFWGLKDQAYILTDEYFNNLAPVHDTVVDFFKFSCLPFNQENLAIVYLIEANHHQQELHSL